MRKEHDSLGCMDIADEHYYGIQTERNRQAFDIGPLTLQDFPPFIDARKIK